MPELSPTAENIITILNNIDELIVKSSDRKNAADVMKALKVYIRGKHFSVQEDNMDNFLEVLIDARPLTLTSIIHKIAKEVIVADKKNRKSKK